MAPPHAQISIQKFILRIDIATYVGMLREFYFEYVVDQQ